MNTQIPASGLDGLTAQIDLGALAHNTRTVAAYAPGAALMAVLKADAYGHGALPVARAALAGGAAELGVTTIDEARILTETAIFADKIAVDEETVRLHSHLSQLRDMLQGDEPVGRKLDFLIQEINRECNTNGSKCSDLTITQDVVNMKAEVEKIREQVQNIE